VAASAGAIATAARPAAVSAVAAVAARTRKVRVAFINVSPWFIGEMNNFYLFPKKVPFVYFALGTPKSKRKFVLKKPKVHKIAILYKSVTFEP
jgi:hypothetical protein